jgi:ribosome recycling factor
MSSFAIGDLEKRMKGALDVLHKEFSGLRTGRASVSLLDPIKVQAYGADTPLNQVANISTPEARMVVVNVWDRGLVAAVEKAIRNSGLGLNPVTEGSVLRIPIPPLNEERRRELVKVSAKYAEDARVAVRNVRRDGMDKLKAMEKDGEITQDEHRKSADQVQKLTDKYIKEIDDLLKAKEQDIMQV